MSWRSGTVGLVALLLWSCGDGRERPAATTGPSTTQLAQAPGATPPGVRTVTAALRNRLLYDRNAAHNGGTTFRWLPPIPIHVITGDPETDEFMLEQFVFWEGVLGDVGGSPFYEPREVTTGVPARGIFVGVADLPGNTAGFGDPFVDPSELAQRQRSVIAGLRQRASAGGSRHVEAPEVRADGSIQRCVIILDSALENASVSALRAVIRHEIGHCLGFIGHVGSGLMAPRCCSLTLTSDVRSTMRLLYSHPPGTPVTR